MTVLARVTGRHPAAVEILAQALRADLPGLGVPAVQVAAQTGGGLGRVLADVLGDAKATLHTLIQVQEAIPYPTAALAEANAVVTGRINQTPPVDTMPPETARWCDEFGSAVRQAGHLARAVPPAKEAVRIYRQLAAAHPGTYRPDLANALTNLGLRYSELDRPEEALLASREAADIYRELAADLPDQYRPRLAPPGRHPMSAAGRRTSPRLRRPRTASRCRQRPGRRRTPRIPRRRPGRTRPTEYPSARREHGQ
jgi:tetratricopeptide (TPR) repeat protein